MLPGTLPRPSVIPKQEKDEWCWAAVANFIDILIRGDELYGQCKIAKKCRPKVCTGKCEDINCDEEFYLDVALEKIGRLEKHVARPLKSEEVIAIINDKRPIGVRIQWPKLKKTDASTGHFVAIVGYFVSGQNMYYQVYNSIEVANTGYGAIETVLEQELLLDYKLGGTWSDSFIAQ